MHTGTFKEVKWNNQDESAIQPEIDPFLNKSLYYVIYLEKGLFLNVLKYIKNFAISWYSLLGFTHKGYINIIMTKTKKKFAQLFSVSLIVVHSLWHFHRF